MANQINCACNILEKIDEFYSIGEFARFRKYINEFLKDGDLIEVPVQKKYAGFIEQWFKCVGCGQIWRLVHLDFPFKGFWDVL